MHEVFSSKCRVLIVDDHYMIRNGLVFMLKAFGEFEIVGTASTGAEAVHMCHEQQPNVILMDLMMPEMNGADATRIIMSTYPQTRVIVLSGLLDDNKLIHDALDAGAVACFHKHDDVNKMLDNLENISRLINS